MTVRYVNQSKKKIEVQPWQLEFLKTGQLKWDPVFDDLIEGQWPTDLEPSPWQAMYFQQCEARQLWERIRNDFDPSAFEYAHRKFDKGQIRAWSPDGWRWV